MSTTRSTTTHATTGLATTGRWTTRARRAPLAAGLLVLALTGCSAAGSPGAGASGDEGAGTVTLVTHDSFALSDGLLDEFTEQTGLEVRVVQEGDAGSLTNQLVLTRDAPLGDVVFGIDNAFASRALTEGVVVPAELGSPALADAATHALDGDTDGALTAIDFSDVCMNVDTGWFADAGIPAPQTLDDLADPAYADLLVVPSAVTSSPGLAFLLTTVAAYGEDGWADYWGRLVDNGVQVTQGWSDAYFTDFTAGGGDGPRPVVLSYASSIPATLGDDGQPTTAALLDTCFRQTEYAGVLAGAANPEGGAQLIDFLLSDAVQADIPGSMYVYPVSTAVDLPADWAQFAPLAEQPYDVPAADVEAHREAWLQQWTDVVTG